MAVLIILIVVWLVTWLQRWIYQKLWDKNLDASVSFGDKNMSAGQETELIETMGNAKWLPLPWVQLKFEILRNGKSDNLFRAELFNILFHQQIVRKSKLTLKKRGVYQIKGLSMLSYDLFLSRKLYRSYDNQATITVYPNALEGDAIRVPYEKLMGQIATRRYTLEDPFLFKGIREYQPQDGFRDINFKASARNSRWLVNTHEYTLDQKVKVVLLTDKATLYYDENEYETSLRYAAELVATLERDGIPTAFYSNGLDALDRTEPSLEDGCSENHIESVLEAMARLDLYDTGTPGDEVLRVMCENRQPDEFYVIIAPDHNKNILDGYRYLQEYTDACQFISPISFRAYTSMTEEEQKLEETVENFFYYQA